MEFKGYRIGIILVVFIVSLGLSFGAQYLSHQKRVIAPIYERFLTIPGVLDIDLTSEGGKTNLVIILAEVEKLDLTIKQVLNEATDHNIIERIIIVDQTSPKLEDVYYQMHFTIEQALELGTFEDMALAIAQVAQANDVHQRSSLDRNYVYLQLHDGEYYYYQVFSRNKETDMPILRNIS